MKQYPHKLYSEVSSGDSSQDSEANYTAQTSIPTLLSDCRAETFGRGGEVIGIDGKSYKYSSIIYLPISAPDLKFGDVVFVRDSETLTTDKIKGKVLEFDRNDFHCRIKL